jgi:hypothetical protein
MRVAQIRGPGIRGHASRHHPAQHRFSQLMAAAVGGASLTALLRAPVSTLALIGKRRADANISNGWGTLHSWRRCQPIPKRSGIDDQLQSAVPHDQIQRHSGDISASGPVAARDPSGHGVPPSLT